MSDNRFNEWSYPEIEDGKPTKYNWIVQNLEGFDLGVKTDVGECRFVADGVGITVNSRNSDELSNEMLKIINDKSSWKEYSKNCLKVRMQYDWKFMTGRVESAYTDILN